MGDPGNSQGPWLARDTDDGGGDVRLELGGDTVPPVPSRRQRPHPQPSGAQNRRVARERAKELAEAGQLEPLVRVADCEPLVLTKRRCKRERPSTGAARGATS